MESDKLPIRKGTGERAIIARPSTYPDRNKASSKKLEKTNVNLNTKHDFSRPTNEDTKKWCKDFHEKNKWLHDVVPFRKDGKGEIKMLCYIQIDDAVLGQRVDSYLGMKIIYRKLNTCSKESQSIEKKHGSRSKKPSKALITKLNRFVNTATNDLMSKHSNVTMIRISHTKSKGFRTALERHDDEFCVVIYTRAKSYVPLGEFLFPEYVKASDGSKIKTDVREGYFRLGPKRKFKTDGREPVNDGQKELKLGQSIGPASIPDADSSISGSLGPFVTVKEGTKAPYDAFLTAAHLFIEKPDDKRLAIGTPVNQPADGDLLIEQMERAEIANAPRRCGTVRHICFDDSGDVGIDMAVVKIAKDRMPTRAMFTQITNTSLTNAGFFKEKFPIYDDGSVVLADDMNAERMYKGRVVKFGNTTGLTVGELLPFLTTVAVEPWSLRDQYEDQGDKYTFKGQFQVKSSSIKNIFFQDGDSGAAVFFADEDDNRLQFLGLAIGITSDGICLVTQAQALLAQKLKGNAQMNMKDFKTETSDMNVD